MRNRIDPSRSSSETPRKPDSRPVSTPSTGMKMNRYPPESAPRQMKPIPNSHPRFVNATPTPNKYGNGKDNGSPKQRRNPCNCKKSNCLKLYCICFQAKLFCDGCNCNDCNNTEEKKEIRDKAIKDTIAKNPNAFKPRFSAKQSSNPSPSSTEGHNTGCKCKRSQCLKKYCECFEAGVTCIDKCKCVDCQNFIGSQQLIDRRRKIKDHKGAEMAMRSSHDAWKHGLNHNMRNVVAHHGNVFPSPAPRMGQHPPHLGLYSMISPPPGNIRPGHVPPPPPHFMGRNQMIFAPVGYSPMGMQPVTPGYSTGAAQQRIVEKSIPPTPHFQQRSKKISSTTPKNPAARKGFNPHSIKKNGKKETTKEYFGLGNKATKTTALTIFSFLSNDDIYNATLVCHAWNELCLDEQLWQFEETV